MSEKAFSTKEQLFILAILSGLFVAVVLAPMDPMQKLFPLILILLVASAYAYILHLSRSIESQNTHKVETKVLEKLEGKEYNVFEESSLSWLYVCIKEALRETRPLVFNLIEKKNPYPLGVYIRILRCHFSPCWSCSVCGRPLRYAFKPLYHSVMDTLLDENANFLASPRIRCVDCDPFFSEIRENGVILLD